MYSNDNGGLLVPNNDGVPNDTNQGGWVRGWMDYNGSNPDDTNILNLTGPQALFSAYIKSPAIYKCPADQSHVKTSEGAQPRVRSYSMNSVIGFGSMANDVWLGAQYRFFQKESDIASPAPANLFILIDEHPDSINDPPFDSIMHDPGQTDFAELLDFPAWYHNNSSALSFADGHSEIHHWLDYRTLVPITGIAHTGPLAVPNDVDADWICARTSSRSDGKNPWW
jgi:prepilin-type processing-associated H-X9-DG protein